MYKSTAQLQVFDGEYESCAEGVMKLKKAVEEIEIAREMDGGALERAISAQSAVRLPTSY